MLAVWLLRYAALHHAARRAPSEHHAVLAAWGNAAQNPLLIRTPPPCLPPKKARVRTQTPTWAHQTKPPPPWPFFVSAGIFLSPCLDLDASIFSIARSCRDVFFVLLLKAATIEGSRSTSCTDRVGGTYRARASQNRKCCIGTCRPSRPGFSTE